jgi:hypothetical protein
VLPLALTLGLSMALLFALLGWLLPAHGLTVRIISLAVDAFLFAVAVLVFRQLAEHPGGADYAWLLITAFGLGALLHAFGVLDWDGDAGFVARGMGTVLVFAALVVPSTLTLALPLAAFLALSAVRSGTSVGLPTPRPRRSQ